MARYEYRRYKINIDPESKKVQGLCVGDVVRRQYRDGARVVYSLMVVIESGAGYFVGALLEGDEPKSGELLDFVRVTSLTDKERGGALYMTASDSGAPFLDVIDGMGFERSLLHISGTHIFRDTTSLLLNGDVGHPEMLLVSYRIKGEQSGTATLSIGYADEIDGVDEVEVSTEWQYKLSAITIDYPEQYQRQLTFSTDAGLCQVENLNIVRLSDVAVFSNATKVRVGKISGIVDPLFGKLEGYGAYFQNLYATRNINIAGTLTAGDENGFASTFYVGKIHKNVILNSLECGFSDSLIVDTPSPVGIGLVREIPSDTTLIVQTSEWREKRLGKMYTFSIWIKGAQDTITLYQDEHRIGVVTPTSLDWQRVKISFEVQSSQSEVMAIRLEGAEAFVTAPQLEGGEHVSQYQPTDGTLSETEDYGAWFTKGGIGGTIQNPLLKLNNDGSISSIDESFVIRKDGTGYFSGGKFTWTKNTIELKGVTIKWNELDEETSEGLSQVIYDKAEGEGWVNKLTYIDANGIYTGTLSANTVNVIKLNASQIVAGQIDSEYINVEQLKSQLITADNINALSLDATKGTIGGWSITQGTISAPNITISSQARRVAVFDTSSNSGRRVMMYYNSSTDFGLKATNTSDEVYVQFGSENYVAGWRIYPTIISKGNVVLGADGSIYNPDNWRLSSDGSGNLAKGNISWDTLGDVTFSEKVALSWVAPIAEIETALGGEGAPKLTYITSTGIYTGTLTAGQVNAVGINAESITTGILNTNRIATGSIKAEKLNAKSIQTDIINTSYISGLKCTFTKGYIGGWEITDNTLANDNIVINSVMKRIVVFDSASTAHTGRRVSMYYKSDEDFGLRITTSQGGVIAQLGSQNTIAGWIVTTNSISKNNVFICSDGSIANFGKWRLNDDGSGFLASENISWDTLGRVTFSPQVSMQWSEPITTAQELARAMAYGKMLHRDPEFYNGTNKIQVLNYLNNGLVTIEHINDNNAPNSSKKILRVSNRGSASPFCGGIRFSTASTNNKVYIARIVAKIPVGRTLSFKGSELGIAEAKWLTPNAGTGNWCEYIHKCVCPTEGSSGNVNLFAITGSVGSPELPMVWDISYATVFDLSSSEKLTTTIDANGIYTGTLTATQVNAVNINADSILSGFIRTERIKAGSIDARKLDADSIKSTIINTNYINGLSCNFRQGRIGGWRIESGRIVGNNIEMNNNTRRFAVYDSNSTASSGKRVQMFYNSDTNFGIYAADSDGRCILRLGSKNLIAGWEITNNSISKKNVSLTSNGSIINNGYWALHNMGGGYLAGGNISWSASGVVRFSEAVSLAWKKPIDDSKELAQSMTYGKMKYRDPMFLNGTNGIEEYNKSNNGNVVVNRISDSTAPNDSKIVLQILNYGTADPDCGGFTFRTQTAHSKIFVSRIIAKIPVGYRIWFASNGRGSDGYSKWLTENHGTGNWSEYVHKLQCGTIGNFSTSCFFYLQGPVGTPTAPVEWRVSFATVYDNTSSEMLTTTIDANGIYTGILSAEQIVAGTIHTDRLNVSEIVNAESINALSLTTTKGTIGGWNINSSSISKGSVSLSYDGSIVNGSMWRLNNDGSGQLANGNIRWDTNGSFIAEGGTFEKVHIKGSVRNPFVLNDSTTTNNPENEESLRNNDNVVAIYYRSNVAWLSDTPDTTQFNTTTRVVPLPWTLENSGRRMCLVNSRWRDMKTSGYMTVTAPDGKWFFEDGIKLKTVSFSNEFIELLGYGDDRDFYGWIVTNRRDIETEGIYGRFNQVLAQGYVSSSGSMGKDDHWCFDGSQLKASKWGEGRYCVTLPENWSQLKGKYFVMLTGVENGLPRYASIGRKESASFDVYTQDDASANNGGFYFQIYSTYNWGHETDSGGGMGGTVNPIV